MGQGESFDKSSSSSTYTKDGRYLDARLEAIKKPFEVVDPLIPNGLFPPEILELILMHLYPASLAKVSISCKLWLQTSARVFQHTYKHRYILPPNADLSTFNPREEVFKQHLIEQQMAKGNCWVQVLSQDYDIGSLYRTSFRHKWSHYGNIIVITKKEEERSSYGTARTFEQTCLIDMGANGVEKQDTYGVYLIGGVRVLPKATQYDWDWEEVTCFVKDANGGENTLTIKRKNKSGRTDINHWNHSPMEGLANLDGSAELLIHDRKAAMRDDKDTFTIEVWNVTNGDLIHEIKLDCVNNIVGFYREFAIMSLKNTPETVFVNLTSGLVEKSFPHQSREHSFCLFDNKIAFVTETEVFMYHYETTNLIKNISSSQFNTNLSFKFTGVSFDKWKLVVSAKFAQNLYSEQSNGFVAVFDMTRDFTLLCTKYISSMSSAEVKLACLPNGSIVVGDNALMVLDFIHPYLEKPINVVIYKESPTVRAVAINPLDLGKFVCETFKCTLTNLYAITYYEDAPRKADHLTGEGQQHLNDNIRRITFIGPTQVETTLRSQFEETITASFRQCWSKRTDTVAPFTFSSEYFNESPDVPPDCQRASAFNGASIMVFEMFNQKTQRWEITEPFVPKGINIDIEYNV